MKRLPMLMSAVLIYPAASWSAPICPPAINVAEQANNVLPGFEIWTSHNGPRDLTFVEFFSGKPENLASLVPDVDKRSEAIWHFSSLDRKLGIWVGCHYSQTVITLKRKLPSTTASCRIKYLGRNRGLIDGAKPISTIHCD